MAINVDTVYKTVLLILNKEQRGYMTPDEFNKTATQSQLEIFESYFEDLNQQLRIPENDSEYADRIKNIQEKISIFQESGSMSYVGPYFSLPVSSGTTQNQQITTTTSQQYNITSIPASNLDQGQVSVTLEDANGAQQELIEFAQWNISGTLLSLTFIPTSGRSLIVTVQDQNFYKLGTVIYDSDKEVQYVQPNELLQLNLSPLTKPSKYWPVYEYTDRKIYIYPTSIQSNMSCTYLRKPADPVWNFTATQGGNWQYVYNASTSQNFEIHPVEQTNLILKILLYAGVVIKDPQIIQVAAQQIAADTQNSKS